MVGGYFAVFPGLIPIVIHSLVSFGSSFGLNKCINTAGECEVFVAYTAGVVAGEIDFDGIVYVKPLRMMIGLFSQKGDLAHKPPGVYKILEFKLTIQLRIFNYPVLDLCQFFLNVCC